MMVVNLTVPVVPVVIAAHLVQAVPLVVQAVPLVVQAADAQILFKKFAMENVLTNAQCI
jgi:hypothetical protein